MTPNAGASANLITGGTLTSGAGELFLNNYDTTSGGSLTIASAIANSGSNALAVTVGGGGATTLSGTLSYTGATTVAAGTLAINSATSTLTGPITVAAGGTSTLNLAPTGTLTLSTSTTSVQGRVVVLPRVWSTKLPERSLQAAAVNSFWPKIRRVITAIITSCPEHR